MLHDTAGFVAEWVRVGHGGGDHAFRTIVCGRKRYGHGRATQWASRAWAYLVIRVTSQVANSGLDTTNSGVHITLQRRGVLVRHGGLLTEYGYLAFRLFEKSDKCLYSTVGTFKSNAVRVIWNERKECWSLRIYIAVYPVHVGQEQGLAMT